MIPTREECIELLKKHNVTKSKLVHTLLVEKVALFLAKKLIEKGESIDLDIISRGALVHDVGKDMQRKTGRCHSKEGYDICKAENIDESICLIVKNHVLEEIIEISLDNIEQKILFYVDKICKNEIIGVDKRMEPWFEKHPEVNELFSAAKVKILELEKEIFEKLDFNPEDLKEMVEQE